MNGQENLQPRAILMDAAQPMQRRVLRVLRGAGYEVDVVEDATAPQPAPGAAAASLYVGALPAREPLLRAAAAGIATVIYGPPDQLPVAELRTDRLLGLLALSERHELESELMAIARHLRGLPLPPLQAYLLWGAPAFVAQVGDIQLRDAVVGRVSELCLSLRGPRRVAECAAEVAHELLTNAMYTAPVNDQGEPRYAHDRAAAIALPVADRVSFSFGSDGLRLALEVHDRFGRLRREHLCASLARGAAGQVRSGQGGAGIGLAMVQRAAEVLQVEVLPGTRTRVTAVLSLEPRSAAAARQSVILSCGGGRP